MDISKYLKDDLKFLELLTIKDKLGKLVSFIPNKAQKHFHEHRTGRDILLKSRQQGFSTYEQGMQYKRATTNSGRNVVTISHSAAATRRLKNKFDLFYAELPAGAKPSLGRSDKTTIEFPGLRSAAYIETAGNPDAVRGDTIHHAHLSEVAFWENASELMTALLAAVPEQSMMPESTVVLECTANGASGYFYELCMSALHGDSEFKLHVYPWWWADEYKVTLERGEKLHYSDEEEALVRTHKLKPEQIKWRRKKLASFAQGGDEMEFFQEYLEDPITCFLLSGRPRFNRTALKIRLDTQVREPVEILWDGRIQIFEAPQPDHIYVIGADPSEGIGQDYASAVVRDVKTNTQVATLRASDVELIIYSKHLCDLATMYNDALVGIERNNHGHTVLNHFIYGSPLMESYPGIYVGDDENYGWHTNTKTRPIMIDDLAVEYADVPGYTVRDRRIVEEALRFVKVNKGNGRSRAEGEKYDDLVMSDAIAGQMRHQPTGPSWAIGPPIEVNSEPITQTQ